MEYMTSSSALIDETSPLTAYAENPSSTRDPVDQRRRYNRRCTDWRHKVTSSFGGYGKYRLMPSSTSYLETKMRAPTGRSQWVSSWLVIRKKIKINMVSIARNNNKEISIFPLIGWHSREGSPRRTHEFNSTHGDKNRGTPFTRTYMGQHLDCNRGCEVVLPHYLQSLSPQ